MRMNGFGYALRETGHSLVPVPPERITGTSIIQLHISLALPSREGWVGMGFRTVRDSAPNTIPTQTLPLKGRA